MHFQIKILNCFSGYKQRNEDAAKGISMLTQITSTNCLHSGRKQVTFFLYFELKSLLFLLFNTILHGLFLHPIFPSRGREGGAS